MKKLYFSDYFGVTKKQLYDYGTIDLSLVADLPLFIDPFLLFNSEKVEYKELHNHIIQYLIFVRDKSADTLNITDGELRAWFCFKEVKENWLGYTALGNDGSGLGMDFARNIHKNLRTVFCSFGEKNVTRGEHLEKLCLVRSNIGKDNISDLTTNLIKDYLLKYTEKFALDYIDKSRLRKFTVQRSYFSKKTESWEPKTYTLPAYSDEYIILTPRDMLTKDNMWINRDDLLNYFDEIPNAISNEELRAKVNNYFILQMPTIGSKKKRPTEADRKKAIIATIYKFPELIDYYIKLKEDKGSEATLASLEKVRVIEKTVDAARRLSNSLSDTSIFYQQPFSSLHEAITRAKFLKDQIENHDGYLIINDPLTGKPSNEKHVQLLFRLVWYGSPVDLNAEANNGRGPVDYVASLGSIDKAIVEFKLASNTKLRHGLEKQTEVYLKANNTDKKVIIIICYTKEEQGRVNNILADLKLINATNVVVIDARNDNKASASKA